MGSGSSCDILFAFWLSSLRPYGRYDTSNRFTNQKVEGPYILAGHSMGSLMARLFAQTYPDEVVGLALVDPRDVTWSVPPAEVELLAALSRVGFFRLTGVAAQQAELETKSPWASALAHGSLNASAALPLMFLQPGLNITWGGTLASVSGWVGLVLFVAWLIGSGRLSWSAESEPAAMAQSSS